MPIKKSFLLFIALLMFFVATAQTSVDSLLNLCEKASETQKTKYFLEISFYSREDTAKSNLYSRMAYQFATRNNQLPEQAKALYYLGETRFYSRDFASAIPFYGQATHLFEHLKDTFLLTNCYSAIGLCYNELYQGEKAIANFIQALKLCDNNPDFAAEITSNIAMTHAQMDNFVDAIKYYRKALAINKSIKDSTSTAVNYNGIGSAFSSLNNNDSALINFSKAYYLFKKVKNTGYQAIALSNIANIYPNYPDSLNKAIDYFNQSWIKFKELGWNHYEADIQQGIGFVLLKQGKYQEAHNAFNKSLVLTDQYDRGFALKKHAYHGLSEVYEKLGDYKTALKYHILYAQTSDSLAKIEKYQQLLNMEKQYETDKKETQIIRLQSKQELTDIQLRKNRQLKQLGFITAFLLLIFIVFVLIKYFDKIKSNKLLEEKNKVIEQSEQELRSMNAAKNKFFSIIAHDLKNPFHTVMGYSYLLNHDYERFTEPERRKFAVDIHQSTNSIFRLLQNLLDWSSSQTGRLKFAPIEIELTRMLDNSVSVLRALAEQKNIQIIRNDCSGQKVFVDPLMIETVLRNLINNAIKFTPENGTVEISTETTEDQIKITISDSGIGISDKDIPNLFRIDSKVKRKGTNNEDGSGLGLILCKEFVDKNSGTIWVQSSPGKGSSFSFTVPVKAIS